ncbi:MAG: GNAT family N-acetyltransferase [Bacteroidetes bacterium]|nr:MAG: GNAT family N-acetyltransferase [Bacteroidota bacterium]
MEIIIREAKKSDINNLAVLKQQVWISTYADEGVTAQFSEYVLSEYSIENIRKSISDKSKLTLIAIYDKGIVGCVEILLSPQSPVNAIEPCMEISTFYILERFQGLGIGKKLLQECFKVITRLNHYKVWLTVYYKNQKAIDFYAKQNFTVIGETFFLLGKDKHKNLIMLRNIDK